MPHGIVESASRVTTMDIRSVDSRCGWCIALAAPPIKTPSATAIESKFIFVSSFHFSLQNYCLHDYYIIFLKQCQSIFFDNLTHTLIWDIINCLTKLKITEDIYG